MPRDMTSCLVCVCVYYMYVYYARNTGGLCSRLNSVPKSCQCFGTDPCSLSSVFDDVGGDYDVDVDDGDDDDGGGNDLLLLPDASNFLARARTEIVLGFQIGSYFFWHLEVEPVGKNPSKTRRPVKGFPTYCSVFGDVHRFFGEFSI